MITRIHSTSRFITIFFALLSAIFFIELLVDPMGYYSHWLEAAVCAAGVSVIALLLNVIVRRLGAEPRFSNMLLPLDEASDQADDDDHEWTEISHRREQVGKRLQIDEPRLCSKRGIPCTCWSFCGGDPDLNAGADVAESISGNFTQMADENTGSKADQLPIIERGNATDCPF